MAHLAHYKEAHPLPFVITHWVNLICMFTLIFTGFYIHYPFFPLAMSMCRGIHVFCGIVITINLIMRVVLSFFIKSAPSGGTRAVVRDFKTWLPQRNNRHMLLETVKYYLFMNKGHCLGAKLGVLQKIFYLLFLPLILLMAWTGFALWIPTSNWAISLVLTEGIGVMNIRIIRYITMFIIMYIMCFHLYLANIEGVSPTKLILFRKEHAGLVYDPEIRNVVGYDGMGHGPSYGAAPRTDDLDKAGIKC